MIFRVSVERLCWGFVPPSRSYYSEQPRTTKPFVMKRFGWISSNLYDLGLRNGKFLYLIVLISFKAMINYHRTRIDSLPASITNFRTTRDSLELILIPRLTIELCVWVRWQNEYEYRKHIRHLASTKWEMTLPNGALTTGSFWEPLQIGIQPITS